MKKQALSILFILALSLNLIGDPQDDLFKACMSSDLAGVTKAVEAGADVNALHSTGQNALALSFFSREITQFLLEKGCDPNGGNYPAVISAGNNYSVEVMEMLLKAGADPNREGQVTSDPGAAIRPLIEAEKAKGKDANKILIKTWENIIKDAKPTVSKVYAVQLVVQQTNCVPCLKMLLENGAKTDLVDGSNILHVLTSFSMSREERKTAFAQGASVVESFGYKIPDWYRNLPDDKNGTSVEMLEAVLKTGIDINKTNSLGFTPLVIALKGLNATPQGYPNKLEVVKSLIAHGADVTLTSTQDFPKGKGIWIPICLAAEFGDSDLMKTMVTKGADMNASTTTSCLSLYNGTWGGEGYTPLIISIMVGKLDIANYLLDSEADFNTGSSGFALLEISNSEGKATISTKNKTPIYWAIDNGNMELIKKISDKMQWKFNKDFSFKAYEGDLVMQTGWGPMKLKGQNELSPAMYADIIGNKEAKKLLMK